MRLYLIHVGFYDKAIGIYEQHSNLFVAAPDVMTAKQIVKKKEIFIKKKMHIDAIQEISVVDGYQVELKASHSEQEKYIDFDYDAVKAIN